MRAIVITCVCSLLSATAPGQTAKSIDTLIGLPFADRADALLRIRESDGGLAALHDLELAARSQVDARRARGQPPLSEGCLSAAEFELDSQVKLARQAADADEFTAASREFAFMAAKLDSKLADARRTNDWKRQFPPLRHWEREWRAANDPRARELFLRTLNGQAIRLALVRHKAPAGQAGTRDARHPARAEGWATLADNAYREYIFNLMCANDEENLRWFKRQVAELGWFGQKEYGWAADQAALLIAQHADADPGFQESVVAALWPRLASNDTDPENFAYLVDRVAVHARRPQTFGTQMECVNGEWIVPEIQDHSTLDDRRKRVNLVAYDVQLARIRGMCRN